MSKTTTPEYRHSPEHALHDAASRLFGDAWASPLAQLTGINLRTCQRVAAAIHAGKTDPRADTLRTVLRDCLSEIAAGLDDVRDSPTFRLAMLEEEGGAEDAIESEYLAIMQERCEIAEGRGGGAISLWSTDLSLILEMGRDAEDFAKRALLAATALFNEPGKEPQRSLARVMIGDVANYFRALPVLLDDREFALLRDFAHMFPAYDDSMPDEPRARDQRFVIVNCEDDRAIADLVAWVKRQPGAAYCGRLAPWKADMSDDLAFATLIFLPIGLDVVELIDDLEDRVCCSAVPVATSPSERAALAERIWSL